MVFIKRYRYWIFLVLMVLPIAMRGLWFYHWFPAHSTAKTPDFANNIVPAPPISTLSPDQASTNAGTVVLVDTLHGNQFSPSEIDSFSNALTRRGARIEYANKDIPLVTQLKYTNAYVVFSPNVSFSAEEVNLVRNFVANGGRLILFTDPTRGTFEYDYNRDVNINLPDVNAANNLLAPFGISVNNDYLYNLEKSEGNFRNVLFEDFSTNAVTSGMNQLAFYGVHSVEAGNGTPLIVGNENTYSSLTDSAGRGMAVAAVSEDGNVLVLGDFSFLIPPYNTVVDNQILIRNIANYALDGTRAHSVADFPYVFDRTVYLVPTGGFQMTAETLTPFASLQNALLATSTKLVMRSEAPAEGDLLVIGSLTPGEDLLSYIEPFHLGLDEPGIVVIPEFGTVSSQGVGLLLYLHTPLRNTLILLTELPEDLPTLIDQLSSGDLSSCVTQGDIGVCSLGYGGSYYAEPTEESIPTEATPTSSG